MRFSVWFASTSLSDAEKCCAVIENEALAITWACDKFTDYLLGLPFTVEIDYKLLIPLLASTELNKVLVRIQRFRLRLIRYSPEVKHVPGKRKRLPVAKNDKNDDLLVAEVETFANIVINVIPASSKCLQEILNA